MTSVYTYTLIFLCISIKISPSISQLLRGGGLLPSSEGQVDNVLFRDISKCVASVLNVSGSVEEIITSFLRTQLRLISPQCCKVVLDIHYSCWLKIFPFSSLFPLTFKRFCSIQGSLPPTSSPRPLVNVKNEDRTKN
ncbi:hypothetical protein R3W88_022201 [Solanum pinnatisectum]|uniref:Prolamin-like domain-containing protein n=1 Tax=Solanum pinnatisectum TaxID=50273 RepID=A0AAV9LUN9_9SOLN|nr:hypothetical protein R3W88_022201 [Solanum pinnatisectum]